MTLQIRSIRGHYREEGGSLTPGSLVLIEVSGKGVCTEGGGLVRARRFKVAEGVECVELYGPEIGFEFFPDEGECERVGIPVDSAE